jgi:hypothetical protein
MAQRGQSPHEVQEELEAYRDRLAREKSRQAMIRGLRWPLVCAVLGVIIVALIFILMSDRPKEWVDDLRGIDVADPVQYVYPTPTPVPTATPNPTATPTGTPTLTPTAANTPKGPRSDGHGFFGKVTDSHNNLIVAGASIEALIRNVHFAQSIDPATDTSTQTTVAHAASTGLNFGVLTNFQVCGDYL